MDRARVKLGTCKHRHKLGDVRLVFSSTVKIRFSQVRERQESVRSGSCNASSKLLSTKCVDKNVNSGFTVECVMRATENGKKNVIKHNHKTVENQSGISTYTPPPLDLFDKVQICSGLDLISNPSLQRCTELGVDCVFVKQSASMSLVSTYTSLTSGRALTCCKKNAFNSMCLAFRVDPLRLIIPSAAEESHHKISCVVSLVSSALHPNFNNQFFC